MCNNEQLSEKLLVEKIINGNHEAFTILYHRYKNIVYYFIVKLSHGDYYMAEEIVQKTFIKLWEVRKNISSDYSIKKYLQVISKNFFLKDIFRRINEDLMKLKITEKNIDAENQVDDEVELNFLLEEIERIISLLSPARQLVYRLRHIEHLSQKEIAKKLDISENTVETHLKQSTKFLQLGLQAYFDKTKGLLLIVLSSLLLIY
jgi:RNA polymerase sigma-70 factor (ECF subfamily)